MNDFYNQIANIRIGWIIPERLSYNKVMASTRIRVYDVIKKLQSKKIKAELYNPFKKYDIVIFQKAFMKKQLIKAKKLKSDNMKILFDINVNYIDKDEMFVSEEQRDNILKMLNLADYVITPTKYLADIYKKFNNNTFLIEEMIDNKFYKYKKKHESVNDLNLVFCGYSKKANELYLIKDILNKLYSKHKFKLLIISDKDPKLNFGIIPCKFIKFDYKKLPELLLNGDIFISPRDMTRKYNLGHTFTRIGYPMSVGLPVVASPVLSYKGSPAFLCKNEKEWYESLNVLLSDKNKRQDIAEKGIKYIDKYYSEDVIINKYLRLFNNIIN